jgi:hypothetical protein
MSDEPNPSLNRKPRPDNRRNPTMKKMTVSGLAAVAAAIVAGAVFGLLPDAHADSNTDQQFLTVLRNMGLGYPSPEYAISHAHAA